MGFEELVDTLIADGHKTIPLVSNKRPTDDERVIIEEYLVLDESGDIVARKIRIPEGYGGSLVDCVMKLKLCSEGLPLITVLQQKRISYYWLTTDWSRAVRKKWQAGFLNYLREQQYGNV